MMKFEHGDQITRFIGRMGYTGHRTQTFHEVLISVLTSILANPWYDQQLARRAEDRHIIMQWIGAWCDESQRAVPANHEAGKRYEFRTRRTSRLPSSLMRICRISLSTNI
jgi:nicotinamide riboside kinase